MGGWWRPPARPCFRTQVRVLGTLAVAAACAALIPGGDGRTVGHATRPGEAQVDERLELEVVVEEAAVLFAPVSGAPGAGVLGRGDRVTSQASALGEPIDGSARWYLVSVATEDGPARGFVHSSQVRELP